MFDFNLGYDGRQSIRKAISRSYEKEKLKLIYEYYIFRYRSYFVIYRSGYDDKT